MARPLLIAAVFAALLLLSGSEAVLINKLGLVSRLFAKSGEAELEALRSENLSLRSALLMRKEFEALLPDLTERGAAVGVYSSYPFNFKQVVTLAGGADAGLRSGAAVVVRGALVGQITEVFRKTSTARTLFDPRWELSVRIGPKGVDAVVVGGAEPTITLIAKDAAVAEGDMVTAADPALPLGLAMGEVGEIVNEASAPFREVALQLPYHIQALRVLAVLEPVNDSR